MESHLETCKSAMYVCWSSALANIVLSTGVELGGVG